MVPVYRLTSLLATSEKANELKGLK